MNRQNRALDERYRGLQKRGVMSTPRNTKLPLVLELGTHCSARWDQMTISGTSRLCEHCDRKVNDLEAMTPQEIRAVFDTGARVCVRVRMTSSGQLTNRATTAALILSTVMGTPPGAVAAEAAAEAVPQHLSAHNEMPDPQSAREKQAAPTGVRGVVPSTDVKVTARRMLDGRLASTTSDAEGAYSFDDLLPGVYSLEFDFGIRGGEEQNGVVVCPGIMLVRDSDGPHHFMGLATGRSMRFDYKNGEFVNPEAYKKDGDQVPSPDTGLRGKIRGPHGRDLRNGSVTATALSEHVERSVTADELGQFHLTGLLPGIYSVKFSAPGYQSETISSVEVKAGYLNERYVFLCPLGP
jgi:hypothetical protein